MKRVTRALWFTAMVAVFTAAAVLAVRSSAFSDGSFKAFYCAGRAIQQHADPYLAEPQRSCEHAVASEPLPQSYVEPAPLPGYALAVFAWLAHFPVKVAGGIFAAAVVLAVVLLALILAAIARVPPAAVLAVLAPLSLLNLALGEIPPFAALAIALAGYGITTKRWTLAGISAACTAIEPHIGLAVILAVVLFVPRARLALAAMLCALAALSFATIGVAQNVEYLRAVLPAQAFSELVSSDQYSFSRIAYVMGASPRVALALGQVSYIVMLVLGLAIARRAAAAWSAPALLAMVPAAAVLLGGVFMHDIQMIAALPAAVTAAAVMPARRTAGFIALVLLSAVWTQHVSRSVALLDVIGAGGAAVIALENTQRRVAIAAATAVCLVAALLLIGRYQPVARASQVQTGQFQAAPAELSSTAWARYERATPALMAPRFYQQVPTWVALILLLWCLGSASEGIVIYRMAQKVQT